MADITRYPFVRHLRGTPDHATCCTSATAGRRTPAPGLRSGSGR